MGKVEPPTHRVAHSSHLQHTAQTRPPHCNQALELFQFQIPLPLVVEGFLENSNAQINVSLAAILQHFQLKPRRALLELKALLIPAASPLQGYSTHISNFLSRRTAPLSNVARIPRLPRDLILHGLTAVPTYRHPYARIPYLGSYSRLHCHRRQHGAPCTL